jgi:peptidoglycan hydrolase CwlO-like protein
MSKPAITRLRITAALAAVSVIASVLLVGGPAGAQSTAEQLDTARARVHDLEAKIKAGEAQLETLKERLANLSQQVTTQSATLDSTRQRLDETSSRLTATKGHLQALHDRMKDRARNLYMRGPTSLIDVVLGAKTLAQFSARVTYAAAIARQDSHLMLQVRKLKSEITKQRDAQRQLELEQASEVASLHARQTSISSTLAETLATVSELAHERLQAQQLVMELASKLGSELFGLREVAGRGMTISYGEWASSFLDGLGAPVTRNNMVLVIAWETAEGTLATWNPLATTFDMPGATVYNSSGVRNYTSMQQGIAATVNTLKVPNHGYGEIVSGLKSSANPMDTGNAVQASDWCHGCSGGAYVVGIIPAVQQYYDKYAS